MLDAVGQGQSERTKYPPIDAAKIVYSKRKSSCCRLPAWRNQRGLLFTFKFSTFLNLRIGWRQNAVYKGVNRGNLEGGCNQNALVSICIAVNVNAHMHAQAVSPVAFAASSVTIIFLFSFHQLAALGGRRDAD